MTGTATPKLPYATINFEVTTEQTIPGVTNQ